MPESEDTVWLTQEAFDKLTQELEYLKGEGRTAIANKIADARSEGDLSENGGYPCLLYTAQSPLRLAPARRP